MRAIGFAFALIAGALPIASDDGLSKLVQSSPPGCSSDVAAIGSTDYVRIAKRQLGITAQRVDFFLCQGKPFLTQPTADFTGYRVSYPELVDSSRYKGPIVHELAHVLQFARSGSLAQLSAMLQGSKARIELGADFLAGVVYQRAWSTDFSYQSDSALLGLFDFDDPDHHGTQVERNNAFRLGRYIRDEKTHGDIWLDHKYFQMFLFQKFETGQ